MTVPDQSVARDPAAMDGDEPVDDPADDPADDPEDFLPARRHRTGPLTVALVAVLVAALGVLGGVQLQKARATTTSTVATGARGGGRFGAGVAGRAGVGGSGAGAGAGATFGTVKLVDGDTIYVTATDGSIVKVKTTAGTTTITRSVTAAVSDLQPGQTVVVQGPTGTDGTVAATSVTEGGLRGAGGAATPGG